MVDGAVVAFLNGHVPQKRWVLHSLEGTEAHKVVGRGRGEDAEGKGECGGSGEADAAAARISKHAPAVRTSHGPAEDNARYQALSRW